MYKTLHKNSLLLTNIGYITGKNLGQQRRSPIQGSEFSASYVANICKNNNNDKNSDNDNDNDKDNDKLTEVLIFSCIKMFFFYGLRFLWFKLSQAQS